MTFDCTAFVVETARIDHVDVHGLACDRWPCERCGPIKAALLARDIREGEPNKFLTFTIPPSEGRSPDHCARLLKDGVKACLRYLRKHIDPTLEYVAVFEAHKSGYPHLHLAVRCERFLPQALISQFMEREIGAPVVDVRECSGPAQVADYISKYVSKDVHKFAGVYRYSFSRGYRVRGPLRERPVADANVQPVFIRQSFAYRCQEWEARGYIIERTTRYSAIARYPNWVHHDPPHLGDSHNA